METPGNLETSGATPQRYGGLRLAGPGLAASVPPSWTRRRAWRSASSILSLSLSTRSRRTSSTARLSALARQLAGEEEASDDDNGEIEEEACEDLLPEDAARTTTVEAQQASRTARSSRDGDDDDFMVVVVVVSVGSSLPLFGGSDEAADSRLAAALSLTPEGQRFFRPDFGKVSRPRKFSCREF